MVASAGVSAAWPGRVLRGRWELLQHAAVGGSSSVWRGRDLEGGGEVAVKLLEPEELEDEARFRREVSALASLDAPGILRPRDHGTTPEGVLFLVSDWLAGETLRARLESPGTTLVETLAITAALAGSLGAVHAAGLVHRDVKPENVFLDETGRVLLLDFGLARTAGAQTQLTRSGLRLGTPAYMAPEQLAGSRALDARVDVFALGCVLFEGLAGRPASSGRHAELLVPADAGLLGASCPESPPALRELVAAMLARDRDERPPDGQAIARLLAPLLPGPPGPRRRSLDAAAPTTRSP
jgi:serine/threonine protein kinase